jgi:hypothetical protein
MQCESCRSNVPDHECVTLEPVLLEGKRQIRNASPVKRGLGVLDVLALIALLVVGVQCKSKTMRRLHRPKP